MTIKCAIYTRKSTDEGLEKEFNTLEAQREAGENYVLSQKHQGWELVPDHYDDGGFSGGSMNRPALKQLLEDVKSGKVNMIVVYKIDRLTRSLMDFSKMVDLFEKHGCSFVSVTQNFNTADSMGRLMLNVLLSFAQFEREISGERIRDKIAASKKKGMWMGGKLPYGYNREEKKLVINPDEAKVVKEIFGLFLSMKAVPIVVQEVNNKGYLFHGRPANYEMIRNILQNRVYCGLIHHKGEYYKGLHKAIIDNETFERAQEVFAHPVSRRRKVPRFMTTTENQALLKGLLYCGCCHTKMITTFTRKQNFYRWYYISSWAKKNGRKLCQLPYIPMNMLDDLVLNIIGPVIKSPALLQELANQTKLVNKEFGETEVFNALNDVGILYQYMSGLQKRELIEKMIKTIIIEPTKLHIVWTQMAVELMNKKQKSRLVKNIFSPDNPVTEYPVDFYKKRGKLEIHLPEDPKEMIYIPKKRNPDKYLMKAVAAGFHYRQCLEKNGWTIVELANHERLDRAYIGRLIQLTYLAPDIIDAILHGTQPTKLTPHKLIRADIPPIWEDQRKMFGFNEQ